MNMVSVTIDDQIVQVEAELTILQAIRQAGVDLPTLCHLEGLPPYGACRLCLVEILNQEPAVIAACTYPVADGLVITTTGPRATAVRNMMLEFLLARCPTSEKVQELAAAAGLSGTRFPSNGQEDELCVLCGLCVRVCRDLVGAAAIGFIDRGAAREVGTPFKLHSEACIGCGACVAVCPTGLVQMEDVGNQRYLQPWNTAVPLYTCPTCGRPTTPEPMAFLKEQVPVSAELWGICPRCRRKATLEQLAVFNSV
jgi:bidirectional [NiFe] hydrogenase diaphorase subunit